MRVLRINIESASANSEIALPENSIGGITDIIAGFEHWFVNCNTPVYVIKFADFKVGVVRSRVISYSIDSE